MSKLYKTKKAALARRRREREKKHLEVLRQLASAPTATSSVQREYHAASERRSREEGREGGRDDPKMFFIFAQN